MSVQEKQAQEIIIKYAPGVDGKIHGGECFLFFSVSFVRIVSPLLTFPVENMFGEVLEHNVCE